MVGFGEEHHVAGAHVDFDDFVLESLAIAQCFGDWVVGFMAAGDYGQAAVAGPSSASGNSTRVRLL